MEYITIYIQADLQTASVKIKHKRGPAAFMRLNIIVVSLASVRGKFQCMIRSIMPGNRLYCMQCPMGYDVHVFRAYRSS